MPEEFNYKLCEERHEFLNKWAEEIESRMKSLNNRFLVIMTTLSLNLIGVIIILAVMFLKK